MRGLSGLRARVVALEAASVPPRTFPTMVVCLDETSRPPEGCIAASAHLGRNRVDREPDETEDAFVRRACAIIGPPMVALIYADDELEDEPAPISASQPTPSPVDANALAGIGRTDERYAGVWQNWQLPRVN